ncbi:hypothetical protein RRSWK_02607 [Rhodopirellula sp. SWK7]|nr:hypothetical protein RRSWK_02607 [Rhodopirellula sp. SWK7]
MDPSTNVSSRVDWPMKRRGDRIIDQSSPPGCDRFIVSGDANQIA